MNLLQKTSICALALTSLGCAHQPISLAEINQARAESVNSADHFQWQWQGQAQRDVAELELKQWLSRQDGRELSICICTSDTDEAVNEMLAGWSHLKLFQQHNPMLKNTNRISVARDPLGPLLRIQAVK